MFSAYCGGLHVAALRACLEMARIVKDTSAIEEYENWLPVARKAYSDKLWNGKYYSYDSSRSNHHDSIMSDQLAGFWYLRLCGHEYEVRSNSIGEQMNYSNIVFFFFKGFRKRSS